MKDSLADVPAGGRVFVDANIFIYHFTGVSPQCTELLTRCEQGDIVGVTGVHTLLEVLHRLMMIEAVTKKFITPGNVVKKLRARRHIVKRLKDCQEQTEVILKMGLGILPLSSEALTASAQYREKYGLLVSDSVTVALAVGQGIKILASADQDFEQVAEVDVYRPTDISETTGDSKKAPES